MEQRLATNVGAWYQGTSLDASRFGLYGTPASGVALEKLESRDRRRDRGVPRQGPDAPKRSSAPRAA